MALIFFPKLKLRYDMTQDVHNRGTWYLEHGYSLVLPNFSSNITYSLNQVRTEWETRGLCCDCAFLPWKHVSRVHVFSRWTASGQVTVMGSLGVNSPILHLLDQVSYKTLDCGLVWFGPTHTPAVAQFPMWQRKKRGVWRGILNREDPPTQKVEANQTVVGSPTYVWSCFHVSTVTIWSVAFNSLRLSPVYTAFLLWQTYPQYRTDLRYCPLSSCVFCRKRNFSLN